MASSHRASAAQVHVQSGPQGFSNTGCLPGGQESYGNGWTMKPKPGAQGGVNGQEEAAKGPGASERRCHQLPGSLWLPHTDYSLLHTTILGDISHHTHHTILIIHLKTVSPSMGPAFASLWLQHWPRTRLREARKLAQFAGWQSGVKLTRA